MSEDKGILWSAHHCAVNKCKHPEITKPNPPEAPWFEKKPFKCMQCGEQIHATQIEEASGKWQVINYAERIKSKKRSARRSSGFK